MWKGEKMTTEQKVSDQKLFIDGKWAEPSTNQYFKIVNPANEEVVCSVAQAGEQDVDLAVKSARRAFDDGKWATLSAADRENILFNVANKMQERLDELAFLETVCTGKPINESKALEVGMAIEVLRYYAGWTTKIEGSTILARGNNFVYTLREPLGVIAAIPPWNFPILLAMWKIAPALACGNTVVVKPASQTPLTALKLAEIAKEAGLPDGVLNVITGPGHTVGTALVKHPGVDKIGFTGETYTGKEIMKNAADSIKQVTLELGGKSPNIVFADAELEQAVKGALLGIFYNKGEVCCAGSRVFVEESIHEQFMSKLIERAKKLQPGNPMDTKTRLGPLTTEAQLRKVVEYVDVGQKEGAKLVTGGTKAHVREDGKGYYFNPTIFDNVNNNMKIAKEEIFGPVLSVIKFKDVNDVIKQANDTIYGLSAGVWTKDIKKAHKTARALKAGTVWVNTYNLFDVAVPFGGYKMSGFGRELGKEAIEHYTQVKSIWIDLNEK